MRLIVGRGWEEASRRGNLRRAVRTARAVGWSGDLVIALVAGVKVSGCMSVVPFS